ncbi:MAG: hypothetical protein WCI27_03405 [Candidatus Omnitrophota bacterium]
MIEKLGHNRWPFAGDDLLGFKENFSANNRLVKRLDVFREPLALDKASIERVGQQTVDKTLVGFLIA